MGKAGITPPTLYLPTASRADASTTVALGTSLRSHLRVLRLRAGDAVRVTDGQGSLWLARLERDADGLACRLETHLSAPPPLSVTLGFGVSNKQRTLTLVEKAVELGAAVLQPIGFARSASVADAAWSRAFWAKAARRAATAMEQGGGAWLPRIHDPIPLHSYLDGVRGPGDGSLRVLLDASGTEHLDRVMAERDDSGRVIVVGPEGGLEAAEIAACREAGFRIAHIGHRVLRFETAAIAALVLVAARHATRPRSLSE